MGGQSQDNLLKYISGKEDKILRVMNSKISLSHLSISHLSLSFLSSLYLSHLSLSYLCLLYLSTHWSSSIDLLTTNDRDGEGRKAKGMQKLTELFIGHVVRHDTGHRTRD